MTTPTRVNPNVAPSSSTGPTRFAPPVSSPPRRHIPVALVVVGSAVAGFLAAVALVAAPVVPATETPLTGAVLCGFAIGWALLAGLSTRLTAQPQRWAVVPALVLGASGTPCWPSVTRRTPRSTGSGRRSCSHSRSGWRYESIATWPAGQPAGCSTPPSVPWVSRP